MKKLFVIIILLSASLAFSQTKETTVLVKNSSPKWDISQTIIDKTDTVVYFYMGFQNRKYTQITDIGSILISKKGMVEEFIKGCKELVEVPDKTEYILSIHNFKLAKYEFSKSIFVIDRKEKYTLLSKKQILELAESLEGYLYLFKD